jgi:hypothetical protein
MGCYVYGFIWVGSNPYDRENNTSECDSNWAIYIGNFLKHIYIGN